MTLLALTLAAVLIAGHAADAPFCLPHKLMLGLFETPDELSPNFGDGLMAQAAAMG